MNLPSSPRLTAAATATAVTRAPVARSASALVVASLVTFVGLAAASPAAWAQGTAKSALARADERGRVADIVRDLLVNDPTLLRDALEAMQTRETVAREQSRAVALKGFAAELARETDTPMLGATDADATVVEFYDYQCGYCKRAAGELQTLKKRDPKLRVIYKELPVLGPESVALAKAALAAHRQGRFEPFHDALMAAERPDAASARALAERLGLDIARYERDLADPALETTLARNRRQAEALDINGTPAFVVGSTLLPGAVEAETLAQLIAAERKQKAEGARR